MLRLAATFEYEMVAEVETTRDGKDLYWQIQSTEPKNIKLDFNIKSRWYSGAIYNWIVNLVKGYMADIEQLVK